MSSLPLWLNRLILSSSSLMRAISPILLAAAGLVILLPRFLVIGLRQLLMDRDYKV